MARSEPSSSDPNEQKGGSGLANFRSAGAHILDPYISLSAPRSAAAQAQGPSAAPSGRAKPHGTRTHDGPTSSAAPRPHASLWTGHIAADNVGFRLLKKAGWSVGTGLGAEEQGRREPIEPLLPKGTRGLGFDYRASQQQQQSRKRAAAADEPEGGAGPRGGARGGRSAAVAAVVREELGRESLGVKVARHKQLMRTEHEQERGRAIEHYLRSAFNDPFDQLRSDNSNPLSRQHKLTDSNPLLDPIGD